MLDSNSIIVDDSLVSLSDQANMYDIVTHDMFSWYLNKPIGYTLPSYISDYFLKICPNISEHIQFSHMIQEYGEMTSTYFELPLKIFRSAMTKHNINASLLRIKANLCPRVDNSLINFHQTPHIDSETSHWVMIYYVHDTDGDTFIFDGKAESESDMYKINSLKILQRVCPKQGRCLIFKGNRLHAGSHPQLNHLRIVLNYNFIIQ